MLAFAAVYCSLLPALALCFLAPTPEWFAGRLKVGVIGLLLAFLISGFGVVRRLLSRGAIAIEGTESGLRLSSWTRSAEVPWGQIRGMAAFPGHRLRASHEPPLPTPFQRRFFGGDARWAIGGPALALIYTTKSGRLRYWIIPHPCFVPAVAPLVDCVVAHLRRPKTDSPGDAA
jgi:hypothetical protein